MRKMEYITLNEQVSLTVILSGKELEKRNEFKYLGSTVCERGEV